jgi:hypothetical protein
MEVVMKFLAKLRAKRLDKGKIELEANVCILK